MIESVTLRRAGAFLSPLLLAALAAPAIAQQPHAFESEIVAYEKQDAAQKPAPGGALFVGSSSFRM